MKKLVCLVLLSCTVTVPALAADGPAPALELAVAPVATPAAGSCAAPLDAAIFAAKGPGSSLVTCIADCGEFPDVSCSTSGTCTAVDRSCPYQRGYVNCGTPIYCPVCACTEGTYRFTWTGNCCDCGSDERMREKCIGGEWVVVGTFCGPGIHCPRCPF